MYGVGASVRWSGMLTFADLTLLIVHFDVTFPTDFVVRSSHITMLDVLIVARLR